MVTGRGVHLAGLAPPRRLRADRVPLAGDRRDGARRGADPAAGPARAGLAARVRTRMNNNE